MHAQHHPTVERREPLISFVVPCYNLPGEWICACIDSILALPLKREEREILVIDDGSDTPVSDTLSHYGNEVQCVRQPNGGLSMARNAGMDMASGVYVQFVDGDDELMPSAYAQCIRLIKREAPDMLLFRFCGHGAGPLPAMSGTAYMLRHNLRASACTYLFRRSLLGNLRFIQGILHEDEAFTPQLMLRARTVLDTGSAAYAYRRHASSITTRTDQNHISRRLADKEAVIVMLDRLSHHFPPQQTMALRRRVSQLTMDLMLDTARLTDGPEPLRQLVSRLRPALLYPLPLKPYTPAYFLFSLLSASSVGLSLLRPLVSKLTAER